jgi:hypothetical protein
MSFRSSFLFAFVRSLSITPSPCPLARYLIFCSVSTRLPAFSRRLPAIIPGTVNDATKFPPPDRAHGSYHWAFERVLSAALIPLTVGAAVTSGTAHVSVFSNRFG